MSVLQFLIVVWSRNVWHSWRSGGFCKTLDAKTKICRGLVAVFVLILQRVPTPRGALKVNTLLRPALGPILTSYNENWACGIIWTLWQSVLCVRTVNGKKRLLERTALLLSRSKERVRIDDLIVSARTLDFHRISPKGISRNVYKLLRRIFILT